MQKLETVSDTERVGILLELAQLCERNEPRYALEVSQEALRLARQKSDQEAIAISYHSIASSQLSLTNYQEALSYFNQELDIRKTLGNRRKIASCYGNLALVNEYLNQYQAALDYHQRSLEIKKEIGFEKGIATSLYNMSNIYLALGHVDDALSNLFESLKIREKINDRLGIAGCYTGIGNIYERMGDNEQALSFHLKSLTIREEIEDLRGIAGCRLNIATIYQRLDDRERALANLQQAHQLFEKLEDPYGTGIALLNSGEILAKSGRHEAAKQAFSDALSLLKKVNRHHELSLAYLNLSEALLEQNLATEALPHAEHALQIAQDNQDAFVQMHAHFFISKIHETMRQFEQALQHHQRYAECREDIFNSERSKQMAEMQARYEADKKAREAEIYRLKYVEMNHLNRNLEAVNAEKSDLLGIVAHDLKNPLTTIVSSASLCLNYYDKLSTSKIIKRLEQILKSSNRMTEIINKLIDLRAIELRRIDYPTRPLDVHPVTSEIIAEHAEWALRKQIHIRYNAPAEPVTAFVSKDILERILDNLISNAIKFSPPGEVIQLKWGIHNEYARFTITDNGPGLSEDDQQKIFGKFARLSAKPTGGEHSIGLGLSIVKKLTESTHGSIAAHSEGPGTGTTFELHLPRYAPD